MRRFTALMLAIGALTASGLIVVQVAVGQTAQRKDLQVALDILTTVTDYDRYGIFDDVSVFVKDGAVTINGKVTQPDKRTEIEKRVTKVKGVTSVRNLIEVLPVSKFDDDLRTRIAKSIYDNPNFWQYATLAKPPIHIIVQGNKVTLSGVVHSDIDRKIAQQLAMQAGAGLVTNSLKTDAEARETLER